MFRLDLKKQIVALTITIAVISVLIALVIIVPSVRQILALEKDITDTQTFFEQQYERSQKMRRSVHNLDSISESSEKYKNAFINEGEELPIITELEKLASKNNIDQNLRVQFVNPKDVKGVPSEETKLLPTQLRNKAYYTFSFSSTGKFDNLMEYMKKMEQLPYYFSIDSIQFDKKPDETDIGVRFNAKIFVAEK